MRLTRVGLETSLAGQCSYALFLSCLHMRVPSVRMSCRQSLLVDQQRDMTKWVSGFSLPLTPVYWYRNAIHLTPLCDAFPLEGIPVSLCYCIGKLYKKMHYMVGYDGCLHEACGCSLDSPPAYNPMHLRPSIVRVCRACFSLPLEAAELHPEFDFDPEENL